MVELGYLLAGAHNNRLAEDIQRKLNAFVEAVNEAGGKCWLQSMTNKEHYYILTEPVSFNYYMPTSSSKVSAFEVRSNNTSGVVHEKEKENDRKGNFL